MKYYKIDDIENAVRKVGIKKDDTIDITCQVAPAGDVATGTLEMWIYIS